MTRKPLKVAIGVIVITLLSFTLPVQEVRDYLSVGKKLVFDKENFDLKWSANPSKNYYKQEYLRPGDKLTSYNKMLLVEAIEGNLSIDDAVKAKIAELDIRKKWDFVANYQVLENKSKPAEAIIDFVVSDTSYIYEWNLYRFQLQKGNNSKNYMVLFAYCYRDSLNDDKELKKFFDVVKNKRMETINKLQEYTIPRVKL